MSDPVLAFSPAHKRLVLGLLGGFALLVSLHLHGFSLGFWNRILDGERSPDILFGKDQKVRSDDYIVQLPLLLAQRHHTPAFPVVNDDLVPSQNMLAPHSLPVWHIATLARPAAWGGFISDDVGIAWWWWVRVFGVFYAGFLLAMVLTRNRFTVSVLAAASLAVAPYLVFWSYIFFADVITFACLTFVFAILCVSAERRGYVWAGLLGWAAAGLALALYPPAQVQAGYLVLILFVAFAWEERARLVARQLALKRFAVAALVTACILVPFLLDAREVFSALVHSTYPGARVDTGGTYPLLRFFDAFSSPLFRDGKRWAALYPNVCEAAGFFCFAPAVLVWLAFRRERRDVMLYAVSGYVLLLVAFATLGLPETLARASLLSAVTVQRLRFGIGLADFVLVLLVVRTSDTLPWRRALLLAAPLAGLVFLSARDLHPATEPAPWLLPLATALVALALATLLFLGRHRELYAGCLAVALAGAAWFNPLARGGAEYIQNNPLSREIRRLHDAEPDAVWATYDASFRLANLPRMLGVKAVGGVYNYPQMAFWQGLDNSSAAAEITNRFAHVRLFPDSVPVFSLSGPDSFDVHLSPAAPFLAEHGVRYVLAAGDQAPFSSDPELERVFAYRDVAYIYRRK